MATRRLGRFTIVGKLGEGGMGAVYRALDDRGRQVALKVLKRDLADQEEYRGRFLREAKIALALKHPHIVQTEDAGEADGQLYIASELVEGGSLAGLLKREGRLSERRALTLARGIVAALGHAHASGLIHRDVKPENVLLTRDEVPKLADLGLARGTAADATRYTRSGEAIGTPCYLAPEQARGETQLDIRCDLYAVGATLFELLTGDPPYTGKNFLDVLQAHLYDPIPDPAERRKDLSLGVRRLVQDLLQKKPRDRPADPDTVIARIDLLLEQASDARPGGPARAADPPPPGFLGTIKEAGVLAEDAARRRSAQPTADEVPGLALREAAAAKGGGLAAPALPPLPPPPALPPAPAPAPARAPAPPAPPRPAAPTPAPIDRPYAPASPRRAEPLIPTVPQRAAASLSALAEPTVRPDSGAVGAPAARPATPHRPPTIERAAAAAFDTVRGGSGSAGAAPAGPPLAKAPGGPPLPRLALVEGRPVRGPRTTFVIGADSLTLGRNGIDRSENDVTVRVLPGNDHREANMRISGAHLTLRLDARGAAVVDLGSANGTEVDGRRLAPNEPCALTGTSHAIDLAGVLTLTATPYPGRAAPVVAGDAAPPPGAQGAVLLERRKNREDHAYALVAGAWPIAGGAEVFRGPGGLYLADPQGTVVLDGGATLGPARCLPLAKGARFRAGEVACEVREILAEDMK